MSSAHAPFYRFQSTTATIKSQSISAQHRRGRRVYIDGVTQSHVQPELERERQRQQQWSILTYSMYRWGHLPTGLSLSMSTRIYPDVYRLSRIPLIVCCLITLKYEHRRYECYNRYKTPHPLINNDWLNIVCIVRHYYNTTCLFNI